MWRLWSTRTHKCYLIASLFAPCYHDVYYPSFHFFAMLFKNDDDQTQDPYTPITPRSRRARLPSASNNAPPSFLRPPTTRTRSTSLPSNMAAKAVTQSRIPKAISPLPNRELQPSRLPRRPPIVASPTPISPEQYRPPSSVNFPRFSASVSTSYCDQLRQSPKRFVKPDPAVLLHNLADYLGPDVRVIQPLINLDDLVALHERECMEREERGSRRRNSVEDMIC